MEELFKQAINEVAVEKLKRAAAGEEITQQDLTLISYAQKMNTKSPLQSLLSMGQEFMPLIMAFLGGKNS